MNNMLNSLSSALFIDCVGGKVVIGVHVKQSQREREREREREIC